MLTVKCFRLSLGVDNSLSFWSLVDGEEIRSLLLTKKPTSVTAMDLSPDGRFIAIGNTESVVRVLHYSEGDTVSNILNLIILFLSPKVRIGVVNMDLTAHNGEGQFDIKILMH